MIKQIRQKFIQDFKQENYDALVDEIAKEHNHLPPFKICETPVFIPKELKAMLLEACSELIDYITHVDFKELSKGAIMHPSIRVPSVEYVPHFIQFDFGICEDENGGIIPKLIELQGFPSLYFYQDLLGEMYSKHYNIPEEYSIYPNGIDREEYIRLLKHEIVGDTPPHQIVLLEVEPDKQPTRIDFLCAEAMLGIKVLCISKMKKEGKELFYYDDAGEKVKILKIYNRVIFDELKERNDLKREFYFQDEVDVEWVGHPNWFFRISKYTMPLLHSKYVPKSFYVGSLTEYPEDLHNYVLKPLYSFAGAGVQLDVTPELLDSLTDKENYIIQEKVVYKPIVETLDDPAKCEVRMMTVYNSETDKHELVCNLVRLSKGKMIGVKYNKDKSWVGGSLGYFS